MIRQTILFRVFLPVLMLMTWCCGMLYQASVHLIIKRIIGLIVSEKENLANAILNLILKSTTLIFNEMR